MNRFFEEMTTSLDIFLKKYENCIIMGDFNIDMDKPDSLACAQLNNFCDIFDLANMINEKTCFSKNHSSRIDLTLSNKPSSFHLSRTTKTGLSDCHKLITTCIKATISRIKLKVINYHNYAKFDERNFLLGIQQEHFECKSSDVNENYENFVQKLLKIVSNHAPLKSKTLRGNNVSFMNKNWRKGIYERTRLKNI